MWFFAPFLGWILGGEFLEGEFSGGGPLLLERKGWKNSTQELGSKSRASKIRFPEFGPKFGFRRCKIPCPELRWAKSPIASVQRTRSILASHSAIPCGANVKRTNANCAIRIAAQQTQCLWGLISVFSREKWLPTNAGESNRSDNSR